MVPVRISRPDNAPCLFVWPWRLEEDARVRNAPLPRVAGDDPKIRVPAPVIHFLVLSSTNLDDETISGLESARLALLETPVFEAGNGRVVVAPEPLSASELTDLFTAADIPLRLCLAYTLRSSA
jgi:hypothetical protein